MNNMVGFDWCLGFFNAIAGTCLMVSCKVRNLNNYLRGSWLIWVFLKRVWIFWAGAHTLACFFSQTQANCCVIFNSVCWNALGPMFAVKIELFVPWICRFKVIMQQLCMIIILYYRVCRNCRRASGFFSDSLFWKPGKALTPLAVRAARARAGDRLCHHNETRSTRSTRGGATWPGVQGQVDCWLKEVISCGYYIYILRLRIYIFGGW